MAELFTLHTYEYGIGCNSYKKEVWMFSGFLLVIRMQALYYKHN